MADQGAPRAVGLSAARRCRPCLPRESRQSGVPAAPDRPPPMRLARGPAKRQYSLPDAEIVGVEVSSLPPVRQSYITCAILRKGPPPRLLSMKAAAAADTPGRLNLTRSRNTPPGDHESPMEPQRNQTSCGLSQLVIQRSPPFTGAGIDRRPPDGPSKAPIADLQRAGE